MKRRPEVGVVIVASIRRSVVLPAPLAQQTEYLACFDLKRRRRDRDDGYSAGSVKFFAKLLGPNQRPCAICCETIHFKLVARL